MASGTREQGRYGLGTLGGVYEEGPPRLPWSLREGWGRRTMEETQRWLFAGPFVEGETGEVAFNICRAV